MPEVPFRQQRVSFSVCSFSILILFFCRLAFAQYTVEDAVSGTFAAMQACGASLGSSSSLATGSSNESEDGSVAATVDLVEGALSAALIADSRDEQIEIIHQNIDRFVALPEGISYDHYRNCLFRALDEILGSLDDQSHVRYSTFQLSIDTEEGGNVSWEEFSIDEFDFEDICGLPYFYYRYPVVSGHPDLAVQAKINALISDMALLEEPGCANASNLAEVRFNRANLLSIQMISTLYMHGAFIAGMGNIGLNINVSNGEYYEFKDLFRANFEETLTSIINQFGTVNGQRVNDVLLIDFSSERDFEDQNFYVGETSLFLLFAAGEISSRALGPLEIQVPHSRLSEILNPNGPLG